jgi:hypothetical protein
MPVTEPHPLLGPLGSLVGTWRGDGTGHLPDQPDFTWREQLRVTTAGTPACSFHQRTTRPDGTPFHAEDGWVRVPPELQDEAATSTRVELAVVSPTGVLEALAGTMTPTSNGLVLEAASTTVERTPAAAVVHTTRRRWTLDGDELVIDFWMATPRHPEPYHHLTSRLRPATPTT